MLEMIKFTLTAIIKIIALPIILAQFMSLMFFMLMDVGVRGGDLYDSWDINCKLLFKGK